MSVTELGKKIAEKFSISRRAQQKARFDDGFDVIT